MPEHVAELEIPARQPQERAADASTTFGPEVAQLVVVLLWASTFVVAKSAFAEVSPLAFTFVRFVLMIGLALAVLAARQPGHLRGVDRADWGRLALVGLSGYTFYQLGFVLGLDRTSPFSSSLLIAMVPLFTVLILALKGEPTPLQGWVGLGVAIVGVVIFLLDKQDAGSGTLAGDLLSIGAAIAFAVYGVINRPLVAKYPAETYTAWTLVAGSAPLLLLSLPEALQQNWPSVSTSAWLSILYMAVFPVYVAYILWNWAIARRGVATATTFSLLVPIASGVLSVLFFGERFSPAKLIGAALVLAGLVIVRVRFARPVAAGGASE